ncbi:MAG: extracellular solute-binding protein [Aggregatilineales bacterium]
MLHKFGRCLLVVSLLLIGFSFSLSTQAQENIILTVAVDSFDQDRLATTVFDDFEAQNPGVRVEMIDPGDSIFMASIYAGVDDHLNAVANYASQADILPLSPWQLSSVMTRAGYILNLEPLVNSDASLAINTYPPAIWEAFQWDGGLWGLPTRADLLMFDYIPAAFDAAGLTYPDASWTIDDIANAARAIATRDANGTVTVPGFWTSSESTLFRALLGTGFDDPTTFPSVPDYTNPELARLMQIWADLERENVIRQPQGINPDQFPFRVTNMGSLNQQTNRMAALLPNNTAGVDIEGYVVSGGTQYPDLAYQLVRYITTNPEFIALSFSPIPAQSGENNIRADLQPLVDLALPNAFGFGARRYFYGIEQALDAMVNTGISAEEALIQADSTVRNDLQIADARANELFIVENNAIPSLNSGEIVLNFGVLTTIFPMPNQSDWEALADAFTAIDPEVAHISINARNDPLETMSNNDCLYSPGNPVNLLVDNGLVLSLDPFLDVDPNFDPNAVIGGALGQLQRDNQTWGLPVGLSPAVLWYNEATLSNLGLTPQAVTWSINDFDAVLSSAENPTLLPIELGNTPWLMLMAAYGGLPIDYRTTPPTINFTDPDAIGAIQLVLDLGKNGDIGYRPLGQVTMGGAPAGDPNTVPLHTDRLGLLSYRFLQSPDGDTGGYNLVTYPQGMYTPVSYNIQTAFINRDTPYRDACYRWISYIAQQPQTFNVMPISRAVLENQAYVATQDARALDVYTTFADFTRREDAIVFPRTFGTGLGDALPMIWLNRAFDNYVLQGADLQTELALAQMLTLDYQACYNAINTQDTATFQQQVNDCVSNVDPTLAQ